MAGEKLISIMKKASRQSIPENNLTDIVFGTISSINPLKIKVENKFEIDDNFLILSPFCYKNDIWEGLKNNDKVILIRFEKGQRYLVFSKC